MNNDPGIMCFRHCLTKNVICKHVPIICPVCLLQIEGFIVDPFRVPYPFANASHNPTSVVIRPSQGNFLDDYDITRHDLHIGVVDSEGRIIEFDKNGLIVNDVMKWTDCIVFKVVPDAWISRWDKTLSEMSKDLKWQSINYSENKLNCFDFVLEFINNLEYIDLKFVTKENLCEQLILPKLQIVSRYTLLYRALKDQEYFIMDHHL